MGIDSQDNKSSRSSLNFSEELARICNENVDYTASKVLLKTKVSGESKDDKEVLLP
jgi:hypothetical protein